ncbi:MAG: TIM-barrel domain-containing protein, partial [Bacteroidota bacterium]
MKYILFAVSFFSSIYLSAQQSLSWSLIAPGVWRATAGKPDEFNFYSVTGVHPVLSALTAMPGVNFPLSTDEISASVSDGNTYLHFPLDSAERIFGLGLNFKTVDQRGRILRLHMDHYGGQDNGRNHAPVPFFISSKGYGVLINAARYIDVWVGTAVDRDSKHPPVVRDRNTDKNWTGNPYSDNIEMLVPAEGAEIIVFAGPEMIDVVRRYNLYNGGGCLPPKWGLGFWHRTPTLYHDKDVLEEVRQYAEHKFPLTVIGLEPGWQTRAYPCTYEWDSNRFPDPVKLIDSLKKMGIYANLWMNPYVSPDGELYKSIFPYTADHTVWTGVVPDYSMPQARRLIADHFKKHLLSKGASGFKMDENDGFDEWLWPDVTKFPSGHSAEQMRQTYALMMQKLTTDLYRQQNIRTYGLVRGSNAGASSFPYVIYNDYYSHPDFITALINSSFIGVLWTPEVRGSATAEEWLRRMQTVCFSPLAMINAWSDGTKPWSFPEVEKQVQQIAELRMQLIPYLYTAFADYAFYGTPPIQAMNLLPGFNAIEKEEVKDQYMFGDDLLIAPLFTGQKSRKVILPPGKWYDFYTGKYAGEGGSITIEPGLDIIPVYARDGAIIPMIPPVLKISNEKLPVEIRYYGSKESSYSLYDDDGVSFDYEKGKFTRIGLSVKKDKKGILRGNVSLPKGATTWSYKSYTWHFMTTE